MSNDKRIKEFLAQIEAGRDYYRHGVASVNVGELDEAIAALQEAIRRSPNFPQAYAWLGYAYLEQAFKDEPPPVSPLFAEARRAAERTLQFEVCPQNAAALAHYVIGMVYLTAYGDRDYAQKKYELLQKLNKKFAKLLEQKLYKLQ